MPPRPKGRQLSKGKSELMPPPPAPGQPVQTTDQGTTTAPAATDATKTDDALSQKILGPEVKALRGCLIDSATIMAQLVNHHTDVQKVGVQRHTPYPPRALRTAWLKHSERYEEILDSIEVQVRRALAAVEYQIEQEKEKIRLKEKNEELQRANAAASGKTGRKPSMFIDLPPRRFDDMAVDPLAVPPDSTGREPAEGEKPDTIMQDGSHLAEEPSSMLVDNLSEEASSKAAQGSIPSGAVVPKDPGLSRTSRSSISLTSLNRHGLRLDLSNLSMEPVNEVKSSIAGPRPSALGGVGMSAVDNAMASPVTLAPKSARPRTGYDGEFATLDLFGDPFLTTAMEGTQLPAGDITSGEVVPSTDMGNLMDDLFADSELGLAGPGAAGGTSEAIAGSSGIASSVSDPTMASLFSAESLFNEVKGKDDPIALLGANSSEVAAQNKLFEALGFGVPPNAAASTSNTQQQGLSLTDPIATFDFSSIGQGNDLPKVDSTAEDFNLLNMENRQLQQRQQFGIDLNTTQPGDQTVELDDFPFDLFGDDSAGGPSADHDINFNDLFSSDPVNKEENK